MIIIKATFYSLAGHPLIKLSGVSCETDKKVKYYTGLPSYSVLIALFDYMSKDLYGVPFVSKLIIK